MFGSASLTSVILTCVSIYPRGGHSTQEASNVFEIHPERCRKVTKHDPHIIHVADACKMWKASFWKRQKKQCKHTVDWVNPAQVERVNLWNTWNISYNNVLYNHPKWLVAFCSSTCQGVLAACHVLGQLLSGRGHGSLKRFNWLVHGVRSEMWAQSQGWFNLWHYDVDIEIGLKREGLYFTKIGFSRKGSIWEVFDAVADAFFNLFYTCRAMMGQWFTYSISLYLKHKCIKWYHVYSADICKRNPTGVNIPVGVHRFVPI